jgi:hypothetical protein
MKTKIFSAIICCALSFGLRAQINYTIVTSGLNNVTYGSGDAELEVGDIDGDGDLDLVTIGDHGSPNVNASEGGIMVYKNNGTGTTWSFSKSGNLGYGGVALGDVNNDGKMDIGYGMHHNYSTTDFGDQLMEVALGDGTGATWTPYDSALARQGQNYGMFGVDFGDINNDGLLDFGGNAFGCCDGIWLYKNLGNGIWEKTDGNLGGNSNNMFKFGDFNNDGWLDCATANEWGQVWKNKGGGVITSMQNGIPDDPYVGFDIADVNNDGAKDFAVQSYGKGVRVYSYNKNTSKWDSLLTGLPLTANLEGIRLADMNMDGNCDVITWTTTGIVIYKGDGAGNWSAFDTIPISLTQFGLGACTTGDFNNDGYTDMAFLGTPASGSRKLNVVLSSVTTSTLSVLPVFPKGKECFSVNSVQFLNWISAVPSGPTATVKIEFSSNGTSGPWTTVAASAPNSGVYQWTTPNVSSSNCYLKYTLTQGVTSQSVIISNAFGIGSCATPPPTDVNEAGNEAAGLVTYPNPMSTTGSVQFMSTIPLFTKIDIYDMVGRKVSNVMNEVLNAGTHTIHFSVSDLNAGVYFLEVKAGEVTMKTKIAVVH